MAHKRNSVEVPELEKLLAGKKKKYVRYEEGAVLYSMGKNSFRQVAQDAHAIVRLNICPESKNSFGMVHGGAIYAMADNATGFAAHTDGRNYVTQTSSLHFLRNQPEGEIQADARVRHRGRSTCLVAVDILGEDETLLATGEFTFFCVDMKMMEQRVKNSL